MGAESRKRERFSTNVKNPLYGVGFYIMP
jgi:hypothetical protein